MKGHNAAAVAPLSCTVLDVQRRMRSSISAITKPDYADIVEIVDHPNTAEQRIGDRRHTDQKQMKDMAIQRDLWTDQGKNVPGIASNVYFWDLKDNKGHFLNMHVCTYVRMYVCMCVCNTLTHSHTRTYTHTHIYI